MHSLGNHSGQYWDVRPKTHSVFDGPLWGAYHQSQNGKAQKSQVPAQQPPTQGHDRDMGTIQNTAALYLRRSSLDDRAADNRSPCPGGRTLRLSNAD
jgi:hypothetical protein